MFLFAKQSKLSSIHGATGVFFPTTSQLLRLEYQPTEVNSDDESHFLAISLQYLWRAKLIYPVGALFFRSPTLI